MRSMSVGMRRIPYRNSIIHERTFAVDIATVAFEIIAELLIADYFFAIENNTH
jgi:hypothetical protein